MEKYYVGQRVKQKDPDEGYMCYGRVKEVADNYIIVDWDDPNWGLVEDCKHEKWEWPTIFDGNPTTNL